MPIDAKAFGATTFTKNRGRLLEHEVADLFFAEVVAQAKLRRYVSSEHFSVDGTLLEAWASHKSFKPKDQPPTGPSDPPLVAGKNVEANFHGEKRSNKTHESTTDPEARLARKSMATPAKMCFAGHLLMEHRNALIVDVELTQADGYAERGAARGMLGRLPKMARRRTVAADKAYDTAGFVADVRAMGFTPHIAPNTTRQRSTIDGRTTRHRGHVSSQRIRKRIEEPFGWAKTIGGGRKLRYKGRAEQRLVQDDHRHLQPDPDHRPRRRHGLNRTERRHGGPTTGQRGGPTTDEGASHHWRTSASTTETADEVNQSAGERSGANFPHPASPNSLR